MEIDGAVCIVTGASSGIGAATATLLANRGAIVMLAARRVERIDALASKLPNATAVPTDVTAPIQLERLVARSIDLHGRVDVLVNNAGQGLHVPVDQIAPHDLRAVIELNLIAPLTAIQEVLPTMRKHSHGAIVNVSSAVSLRLLPRLGGYAATKAALNMLSSTAALELRGEGIDVSVVYPSLTATEFHRSLRAGGISSAAKSLPADPPELAATAIAFAIQSGEQHVLVADPPRAIAPSDEPSWGAAASARVA
jgi:short-subunit dehydrogenase